MTLLHSGYNPKINLSAKEMLEISQEINRDFSPCFSSRMPKVVEKIRFSAKELLDIGEEIGRNFAPKVSHKMPGLMLLPVDPGHLHVYWNLGEKKKIARPVNKSKDQLTLRIYSRPEKKKAATETAIWFDVAIDSPTTHQQVALPGPADDTVYSAAIGQRCADDSFIVFAYSNMTHTPRGHQDLENFTYCLSKTASGQGISKPA